MYVYMCANTCTSYKHECIYIFTYIHIEIHIHILSVKANCCTLSLTVSIQCCCCCCRHSRWRNTKGKARAGGGLKEMSCKHCRQDTRVCVSDFPPAGPSTRTTTWTPHKTRYRLHGITKESDQKVNQAIWTNLRETYTTRGTNKAWFKMVTRASLH